MTKQELSQKIKVKYPEYANIDDNELADKIIAKYPVYKDQITDKTEKKSVIRKVGDFFTGSTQKFGETLGAAASVVDQETKNTREETLQSTNKMVDDLMSKAKLEPDKEKAKNILESAQKLADTDNIDIFNNPEYQKTAKQIAGEAIGAGLEALSFGTYGKATGLASKLPTVLKPVVSPAKKVLTGLAEGAKIGATFGGVSGLSQSLQKNKGLGDIAKETAIGAVSGGLLGGAIGVTTSGSMALLNKGIELTKNATSKFGKIVEQKLYNTATDLVKMSPTAIQKETKFGKNTPKFITDEGILPLIEGEGNKLNTEKAVSALQMKYGEEANAFNSILKDSGEYVSLNELRDTSLQNIKGLKTKGSDYKDAINHINSEIESYKSNYKDIGLVQGDDILLPLEDFNKIKSGLWSKTNFNATQKDALLSNLNYKMGSTARDLIENKLSDTNAKLMNSRLGDFINAIKVLENANGKTLPGGFFGKQFTRIAGTIAGSGGGVTGSIIGNMTGGKLAEIFANPQLKTSILYKVYNKLYKTEGGRSIIEEAQKILENRGLERASRKLLEAPKSIPLGSKTDTSRLFTQEEAQALLDSMKVKESPKLLKAPGQNPILLPAKSQSTINKITDKQVMPIKEQVVKATEYNKGDVVEYLGDKYKFDKNYGVRGNSALITGKNGNQLNVPFEQIKKVGESTGVDSYGMGHRPTETGATADNITQEVSEMGLPNDFYSHPSYYADLDSKSYKESFNILRKIKGKPDAEVTIYRASPKSELNKGDWVTLSKEYAKGESLSEGTKVHQFKVKAKDIQFAGDDINEFGYFPQE